MISVIIPTKGRPSQLLRCVKSIDVPAEFIIIADCVNDVHPDVQSVSQVIFSRDTIVPKMNFGATLAKYDMLFVSDDCEFLPGMLQKLLDFAGGKTGVIGFKTANMLDSAESSFLITQDYYKKYGLFNKEYKHFFADTQFKQEAEERNAITYSGLAVHNHYHPSVTKVEDDTHRYMRGERWAHDNDVYNSWILHRKL